MLSCLLTDDRVPRNIVQTYRINLLKTSRILTNLTATHNELTKTFFQGSEVDSFYH